MFNVVSYQVNVISNYFEISSQSSQNDSHEGQKSGNGSEDVGNDELLHTVGVSIHWSCDNEIMLGVF